MCYKRSSWTPAASSAHFKDGIGTQYNSCFVSKFYYMNVRRYLIYIHKLLRNYFGTLRAPLVSYVCATAVNMI